MAYGNPVLFICGDVNGRNLGEAFDIDNNIGQIATGPTRGNNVLDVIFTNITANITETAVLPPLET